MTSFDSSGIRTWYAMENGVFTGETLVSSTAPKSSNWVTGKRWMSGSDVGRRECDPELETESANPVEMIDGVPTRSFSYAWKSVEEIRAVLASRIDQMADGAHAAAGTPSSPTEVAVHTAEVWEAVACRDLAIRYPDTTIPAETSRQEFPILAFQSDGTTAAILETATGVLRAYQVLRVRMAAIEAERCRLQDIVARWSNPDAMVKAVSEARFDTEAS